MIQIPTVLILGAGASSHVGYPLGKQLINQLCNEKSAIGDLPNKWTREDAESFLTRLSRSGHYSIDAFLGTPGNDSDLGKFLIARQLKQREIADRLFPPNDSGWYQYLFNSMLCDEKPDFSKNALSIVTFNYDRSLEAYFHQALQARFEISSDEATNILRQVPIVHLHGQLGDFPDEPYQPQSTPDKLFEISKKIQIIHEIKDLEEDFCNEEFQRANELLRKAERIYFMGFGYHMDSMRRFRFFTSENTKGRRINGTAYEFPSLFLEQLRVQLETMGFTNTTQGINAWNCNQFFGYVTRLE